MATARSISNVFMVSLLVFGQLLPAFAHTRRRTISYTRGSLVLSEGVRHRERLTRRTAQAFGSATRAPSHASLRRGVATRYPGGVLQSPSPTA